MAAALLVGPPEIYQKPPKSTPTAFDVATAADITASADVAMAADITASSDVAMAADITASADVSGTGNAFVDLMVAEFNKTATYVPPLRGLTENRSPTFLSTGNPCLDFFFHIVPDTPPESLTNRLKLAWDQDPLKALKLVCNLRGVKGTGKSDKEGFYTAALWLHEHHPKTLAGNAAAFADFGYYKDLLEILFRVLEGAEARKLAKEMGELWKSRTHKGKSGIHKGRKRGVRFPRGLRSSTDTAPLHGAKKSTPEEKRIERAKKVVERFNEDANFQFLHDRVSDLFAQRLRSDMEMLKLGKLNKISLAAKWCPSLDSSFDKITLLCETIAKKVFPRAEYAEYEGVEEAHYAYRVRDRLRKEVLVPLRKALELPEVYIGANDWGSLPYNRVASVAMKTYKSKFFKHDEERFKEYLEKVKSGKAKIAAGALLPHEIIASLNDEDGGEVAELQWKRMVEDMAKVGKLSNCLAICDVSGSMYGIPMEVSVALGVLVSELSEEPWKGKLITFSANPQLQRVRGESLKEKTEFVRRMEWGGNTDFQKVFDMILKVAVKGKLKAEEMIKRLFVFSDMEFDQASMNPWETDYEAIVRKYRKKGYGECVPEIVFWNLRDSRATPVPANQPGVALVSGFSKNLMKIFLEEGGMMDPVAVMEAAIAGKEYEKLVVLD
ncbi:uncharacterized protein LOC131021375 [Salvia miltiorrhiza]|uniref:uncharacterized protein LOC131021375 n=1 Tax=Salvia miltiorrhiza TaxID=226208 RepID=UPI0025ABA5AA|nr:uncharacterized protein LOC131021375 [Salvia miltiorrhiza]